MHGTLLSLEFRVTSSAPEAMSREEANTLHAVTGLPNILFDPVTLTITALSRFRALTRCMASRRIPLLVPRPQLHPPNPHTKTTSRSVQSVTRFYEGFPDPLPYGSPRRRGPLPFGTPVAVNWEP